MSPFSKAPLPSDYPRRIFSKGTWRKSLGRLSITQGKEAAEKKKIFNENQKTLHEKKFIIHLTILMDNPIILQ
jgi:hypothetical protein